MMAKKPADRYASPRHLLDELSRLRKELNHANLGETPVGETPIETLAVEVDEPEPKAPAARPVLLAVGGLTALAVLAFVGVLLALGAAFAWKHRAQPEPEPRAIAFAPLEVQPDPVETLKQAVDQHLKDAAPKPAGVDACIDCARLS